MLLADQGEPFASGKLFMDCEAKTRRERPNVFGLIVKNAREDRDTVPFQDPIKFREKLDDQIRSQIPQQEMNGIILHRIQRAAKCPNVLLAIALNVRARDLHGDKIDVAGKDFFCAQKPARDGQDSRTGTDVEHGVFRLHPDPSFEFLNRTLCRFVRSGPERLSGIDSNGQPIVWAYGTLPARNNKEIIAYRKTRIRFLPFLGPIALFHYRLRNSGTLPARTKEHRPKPAFDFLQIGSGSEVKNEARKAGFGLIAFPYAGDTVAGKLADYSINQVVWNIDSQLVPRHRSET
jgi:hypothetical protein